MVTMKINFFGKEKVFLACKTNIHVIIIQNKHLYKHTHNFINSLMYGFL
jgi:hypothetical protein